MTGTLLGIIFIFSGILCLAIRNKPKVGRYMIGFRVPYTFASERAWKRAHEVVGVMFIAFGFMLIILAKILPLSMLTVVMLIELGAIISVGTLVAKREAELESFERLDENTEIKIIKPIDVKPWIAISVAMILIYSAIVAYVYPLLPGKVAIHFDLSGKPDRFDDKIILFIIPIGFMLLMTLIMFFFREPTFKGSIIKPRDPQKLAKEILLLLVIVEFVILLSFVNVIMFNLKGIFLGWLQILCLAFVLIQIVRIILARF